MPGLRIFPSPVIAYGRFSFVRLRKTGGRKLKGSQIVGSQTAWSQLNVGRPFPYRDAIFRVPLFFLYFKNM